MPNKTKKITFPSPVIVDGKEVTELTMREPKVKDMRLAKRGGADDAEAEAQLMANLCEISIDDLDNFSLNAYAEMQKTFVTFIS